MTTTTTLGRNREFTTLWASQALSDLGGGMAALALALLVLAETGSAVAAGVVGTITQVARLVCRLPAGVLVDRFDRRRLMVLCDVIRLAAFAALAAVVLTGPAGLPLIVAVAVLDAAAGAVFGTAEDASLRSIVPVAQLPAAVARNEARAYGTALAGPPLGGLLFGFGAAVPLFGNALSYLASLTAVLSIRKPLQGERAAGPGPLAGFRFVLSSRFLRALLLIAAPLNFAIGGVIFTLIVALQRTGTPPAVIGLVETIVAAGGLLGAVVAPAIHRRLGLSALVRSICWAAVALLADTAFLTSSIAAAVPLGVVVFLGPAANAALFGYQAAITPDHLQGRVISVVMFVATSLAAVAPVAGGLLIRTWGAPVAVGCFAAAVLIPAAASATLGEPRGAPVERGHDHVGTSRQ